MSGEDVIFEFRRLGNVVKVSAVHVPTNTEVSIVGPPGAGEYVLKQTVLRKLDYVLKRAGHGGGPR